MIDVMINIDCRDGMKSIPDKSIDMVCTDLPYGITRNKWDTPILCIHGEKDFIQLMDRFLSDYSFLDKSGKRAGNYVRDNSGALEKIMNTVKF